MALRSLACGLAFVVLLLLPCARAADAAPDGGTLYKELGCLYCHGPGGREPALDAYPVLAGQNEAYLTQQIRDIRARTRDNGYTEMMVPAVASITEDQIAAVAAYLAGQPVQRAATGDEPLYSSKGCASCHGPDGAAPVVPTYPKLAGQNREYLVSQLRDIATGSRDNGASVAMRGIAAGLSDAEIGAIAGYLSGR